MRGAYYDKDTGFFLHSTKNGKDSVSTDLKRQGHIFIPEGDSSKRYNKAEEVLVPDTRRGERQQQRQARKEEMKVLYQGLVESRGNASTTRADLDKVITLIGYMAKQLTN